MPVQAQIPEPCAPLLFSVPPVSPHVVACVVIPVKNEAAHITQTLTAFAQQVDTLGLPLAPTTFEILLLANNCTDDTVAHIQAFSGNHPTLRILVEKITLPPPYANIGYVRRLLMNAAYRRLSNIPAGLILTTDGDTQVAPDWIAQTQAEIEAGADAVGGRILFDPTEVQSLDAHTYRHHLQDEQYLLLIAELEAVILQTPHDPAPTHHQHFNGSFAVTTAAYARAGGIPQVTHLEDWACFERLQQIDARVRHSPEVVVHTSARYAGRAEVGLSHQLSQWQRLTSAQKPLLVASGPAVFQRLSLKKQLHELWERRKTANADWYNALYATSAMLPLGLGEVKIFRNSVFFGQWYARQVQPQESHWRTIYPDVPVEEAIEQLQAILTDVAVPEASHTSMR